MLAIIAVGPTIEASLAHRGQIIRHEIRPKFVALVGDRPELARVGLPLQAGGIAYAAGENTMSARRSVDFPDRGPLDLRLHSVFSDVAVGADPDIELGSILAGQQTFGPMMVDRTAGQISELDAWVGYAGLPIDIMKAKKRVGVGDIEIVADE